MTKIAIYTANVGNYDQLRQPYLPKKYMDDFDFIYFSNELERDFLGVWEVRKYNIQENDNTRIARYIKLHPHILLKEYKYTIWIDSNIEIIGNTLYQVAKEFVQKKVLISSLKHPSWDCAYIDGYYCVRYDKDSFKKIKMHLDYLHSKNYPRNNGLFETQILFRNNENEVVKNINDEWWELMQQFSRRDQLSINYLLWKNNLLPNYIFGDKGSRNHPDIAYHNHASFLSIGAIKVLKIKAMNKLRRIRGAFLSNLLKK